MKFVVGLVAGVVGGAIVASQVNETAGGFLFIACVVLGIGWQVGG